MSEAVRILESFGVVAYRPAYAFIKGSDPICSLMLSQLTYLCGKYGEVQITQDAITQQTGMSKDQQDRAISFWAKIGVVIKVRKGLPCRCYYSVNFAQLEKLLLENPDASFGETPKHLKREDVKEEREQGDPPPFQQTGADLERSARTAKPASSKTNQPPRSARPPSNCVADAPPTLEEWLAAAKEKYPIWPAIDAEACFHRYVGIGWVTSQGLKLKSWLGAMGTCWLNWKRWHPAEHVEAMRRADSQARQGTQGRPPIPEVCEPVRPSFLATQAPVAPKGNVSHAALFGGLPGFDDQGNPAGAR